MTTVSENQTENNNFFWLFLLQTSSEIQETFFSLLSVSAILCPITSLFLPSLLLVLQKIEYRSQLPLGTAQLLLLS